MQQMILTTLWIIKEVSFAIAYNVKYDHCNFVSVYTVQTKQQFHELIGPQTDIRNDDK